jgi:alcohol dehydrogenase class IV
LVSDGDDGLSAANRAFVMSLITYVTKIHFADNVLEDALDAELELLGVCRPLVIADRRTIQSASGARLHAAIPKRCAATIFAGPEYEPTEAESAAVTELYRQVEADGLIAFGSGSAIELAKAVAVHLTHEGPLRQYAGIEGGMTRIRNALPPIIAIPTAPGAGSEASGTAAIVMTDGPKMTLVSPLLVPRVAICDPTLTLALPPEDTACSGMDALTHCIETFITTAYNPPADGIALDGVRRAAANIERAVCNGADIEARREMMAAALNGALAQQKGLGGVHAMSYALGGLSGYHLDHGAVNAILLPHVLEFNAPAVAHRYDEIRNGMNVPPRFDLPEAVVRLRERIGLPATLGEIGVDRCALHRAADYAAYDYANRTNPRRASAEDYLNMMTAAL